MANTVTAQTCITLTTDPALRAKLERKLAEYRTRMQYRAPETDPHGTYKLRALSRLLKQGTLSVAEFMGDFNRFDWYDEPALLDAVSVINAYNSDQLVAVYGGTGLK